MYGKRDYSVREAGLQGTGSGITGYGKGDYRVREAGLQGTGTTPFTCAYALLVTLLRSSCAPVVIRSKKICSDTLPPRVIHMRSNS